MKSTLTVLVGLPGSGKTTFAEKLKEDGAVVVSADSIRRDIFGDENFKDTSKVLKHVIKIIRKNIYDGKDVVFDDVNIRSKQRRFLLEKLQDLDCIKRCVCILAPFEDCLERTEISGYNISFEEMRKLYLSWNTPYWFEGWDKIDLIYTKPVYREVEDVLIQNMKYNQNSPHHSMTLGSHCKLVGDKLNGSLQYAGWLHDIGKPYARTEKNGEVHYYYHENCGAYDCLFFIYPKCIHALDISVIVNLHMIPYTWEGKEQKYLDLWGLRLYRKIVRIHKADRTSK